MAAAPSRDIVDLAQALRPAILKVSRQLRREALKAGVSSIDAQILGVLAKKPGVGVAQLAAGEQMTGASMSGHIKRLAASGWVERDDVAHADRRRVGLRLTPAGEKTLEAIRRRRNDWLATRLDALDAEHRGALVAAVAPLLALADQSGG